MLKLLCVRIFFVLMFSNAQQLEIGDVYKYNNDYSFLKDILKEKKIVLLGEQTHGEGSVFEEKIDLIQYLHEELNYNIIAFESGLYDNYKALKEYSIKE